MSTQPEPRPAAPGREARAARAAGSVAPTPRRSPQQLAGAVVRTADDHRAGIVRDVYRCDRTGETCALGIATGRLRTRTVLVPWSAVDASAPPVLRLRLSREALRGAIPAPATGHASSALLREAEAALRLDA